MPSMLAESSLCKSLQSARLGFLTIDDPTSRGDKSQLCIFEHSFLSLVNRPSRGVHSHRIVRTLSLSAYPVNVSAAYTFLVSSQTCFNRITIAAFQSSYDFDRTSRTLIYKPVARKVRTVPESITEDYHITCRLPNDPLEGLIDLPTHPPEFVPGKQFTQERSDKLDLDPANWLWPEELKLVRWLVLVHETTFVWEPGERARFKEECFPPIKIATVPHTRWVQRNIPIPPAIFNDVIKIIKGKIDGGVYEPSNAAYRSRWFCVVKKDGKSLRLVHDLQPLNAVTVKDAALPPFTDHLTEAFAGYAVYGMMDLYGGYDHRPLHPESRDLTTFGTPLGPHHLTTLPQGFANSAQIFQADTSFILQDEIPHYTCPFIDDLPIKSVSTRYQQSDGSYETIPNNPGIRRFVWEHLIVVNRILQRLSNVGATVSATKFVLAAPSAVIVGHKCTIEGCVPEESKVQKIRDWPECQTVSQVRGFLGTCGVLHMFIKDFSKIARPLINLTRKDVTFEFSPDQKYAMQRLKDAVMTSTALRRLDYESGREVILAVDTSVIAVGFILIQVGEDGKRYPARFGSLSLSEVESRYSQATLELYGLFRVLRAVRVWVFGIPILTVEIAAKYVKGMINNPDLQPNATINRWIAGILLFQFKLVHVPADKHTGANGLSRRPPSSLDPPEGNNHEDWLDHAYGFSMELLNSCTPKETPANQPRSDTDQSLVSRVFVQVLQPTDNKSHIPRSLKAQARDERILDFRKFLISRVRPDGLSDSEFESFIGLATRFFVLDGTLWRRDPHGRP